MKTRAWDGERFRDDYVVIPDGSIHRSFKVDNGVEFMEFYEIAEQVNWKLSRSTGLCDRNGEEIYEDDIVKAWLCFGPAGEDLRVYPVKITPHGTNIQEWTFNESITFWPEVIGDIFTTPELLEEVTK